MIDPVLPSCDQIRPLLCKLAEHGGCVLVAISHEPQAQNYASTSWAHFNPEETKALRAALSRARRKREAQSQA